MTQGWPLSAVGWMLGNDISPIWEVPLCLCQSNFCLCWAVERSVAQHREQYIAAVTRKCDKRLVVSFALADLSGVVGSRD